MHDPLPPVVRKLAQASLILALWLFAGLSAPAQASSATSAGERVTHLVNLLRTSQLESAIELTNRFQEQAATIRTQKPRVLWDEMISNLRSDHLSTIRSRGQSASPLAYLRSLVVEADEVELLEERADGLESVVFVRLRYSKPEQAPFDRNHLLREAICRIRLDRNGNLDHVGLVDEASKHWTNPPLRITMVEWRGEGIGGFRVMVRWVGSGDRVDFSLSLGHLERRHSAEVRGEGLHLETIISERKGIPNEAFPLPSRLRVTDSTGASDEVLFTIPRFHTGLVSPDIWVREPWFSLGDWDAAGDYSPQSEYLQFDKFEARAEATESFDSDGQRESPAPTTHEDRAAPSLPGGTKFVDRATSGKKFDSLIAREHDRDHFARMSADLEYSIDKVILAFDSALRHRPLKRNDVQIDHEAGTLFIGDDYTRYYVQVEEISESQTRALIQLFAYYEHSGSAGSRIQRWERKLCWSWMKDLVARAEKVLRKGV